MKTFATLLALLLLARPAAAAAIPLSCRVPNERPGWCFWVCAETLARAQGVRELYGLKEARTKDPDVTVLEGNRKVVVPRHGGTYSVAVQKFMKMGFTRYRIQGDGRKDTAIIRDALRSGRGCLVHVLVDGVPDGCHAVILTDMDDGHVKYVDLNLPTREYLWDTRANFDRSWTGFALTLD